MTANSIELAIKSLWTAHPPSAFTASPPSIRVSDDKTPAASPMLTIVVGDEENSTRSLTKLPFEITLHYDRDATAGTLAEEWTTSVKSDLTDPDWRFELNNYTAPAIKILKWRVTATKQLPDAERERKHIITGHCWVVE
jgi:hypothetical protein